MSDDDTREKLGECTVGGDHEVVDGMCRLCGAEFIDDEDDTA